MNVRRPFLSATAMLSLVLFTACGGSHTATMPTSTTAVVSTTSTTVALQPPSQGVTADLTWVSETHGWALVGQSGCQLTSEVLTTTNSGTSWSEVGSLPSKATAIASCNQDDPQTFNIRFGNDIDGYAFNPDLFVTTDGGRSWVQEDGPQVAALEIAGSDVIRISYTKTGCPGPCDPLVEEAPIGSSLWRLLYVIPVQGGRVQLVRQGPNDVYVAVYRNPAGGGQNEQTALLVSHDGGVTWSQRADPCGYSGSAENDTEDLAAAPDGVVAVLCFPRLGGPDFVAISSDGGTAFGATASLPGNVGFQLIAVTNARNVFVATGPNGGGQQVLEASHDAGDHWNQAASETGQQAGSYVSPTAGFLGFESPEVGRWIGSPTNIWTTTDGGATWSALPI